MADNQPLGIRLNNPLNIRHNKANDWVGQVGQQKGFVQFEDPSHGVRAADRLLENYGKGGIKTARAAINRYAPPVENDTDHYVKFVASHTGLDPDAEIDLQDPAVRRNLLKAMARMETGYELDGQLTGEDVPAPEPLEPIAEETLKTELSLAERKAAVRRRLEEKKNYISSERDVLAVRKELEARNPEPVDNSDPSYILEVASGINRGILGAADETSQFFGEIAQYLGANDIGDYLVDVDLRGAAAEIGVGQTETIVGDLSAGVAQFLTGFLPTLKAARAATAAKGLQLGQAAAAGALTDAIVFDPHEARLSNLIEQYPALSNPVSRYLESDPTDTAAEGRFKNALEGAALGTLIDGLFIAIKGVRNVRLAKKQDEEIDAMISDRELEDAAPEPEAPVAPERDDKPLTRESDVFGEKKQVRESDVTLEDLKRDDNRVDEAKVESIRESIRRGDDVPEPLVRREEDGSLTVVDGHHRLEAMKREGMTTGDVFRIATDEEFGEAAAKADPNATAQPKSFFAKEDFRGRLELDPALRGKLADAIESGRLTDAEDLIDFNASKVDWNALEDPEQVRGLINTTSDILADFIDDAKGGVQSIAQTKKIANLVGGSVQQVSKLYADVRGGHGITARLMAAQKVLTASADRLRVLAKAAAADGATHADELAFYRQVELHGLVQAQVKGAGTEVARALHAMRTIKAGTADNFRELDAVIETIGGGNPEARKRMAEHIAKLRSEADVNKIVRRSRWGRARDAFIEVYVNGLLSAISTQTLNVVGNTLKVLESISENFLAAGIGKLRGTQGRITLNQAKARAAGTLIGMQRATGITWELMRRQDMSELAAAIKESPVYRAARDEKPVLDSRQRVDADTRHAIASTGDGLDARAINAFGKVIRLPSRAIMTSDELFKQITYQQELSSIAYKRAADAADSRGLTGKAREKAMKRDIMAVLEDTPEDIHFEALEVARYNTFQNDLESQLSRSMESLLAKSPYLKLIVPFFRTPANIVKQAVLERSPGALISPKFWRTVAEGGPKADIALARLATGSFAIGTAVQLSMSGGLSGSGLNNGSRRNTEALDGIPPYSIKVGDTWVQYNRFEPVGLVMGLAADLAEINKQWGEEGMDEASDAVVGVLTAVTTNITDKTWFKGIADLIQMLEDPKRYGESYMKNLSTTAVTPYSSALRRATSDFDQTAREAWTWMDKLKSKLPGLSNDLPPKHDLLGNPVVRLDYVGPAFLSPFAVGKEKDDPVYSELARLEMFYDKPEKDLFGLGEDVDAETYSEFMRIRGQHRFPGGSMQERLDQLFDSSFYNEELSDVGKREMVGKIITAYTRAARGKMLKEDPELIVRLRERKLKDALDQRN